MGKPTEVLEFYNEILAVCKKHLKSGSQLNMERDPESSSSQELWIFCTGLIDDHPDNALDLEDKIEHDDFPVNYVPQKTIAELRASLDRLEEMAKEYHG